MLLIVLLQEEQTAGYGPAGGAGGGDHHLQHQEEPAPATPAGQCPTEQAGGQHATTGQAAHAELAAGKPSTQQEGKPSAETDK